MTSCHPRVPQGKCPSQKVWSIRMYLSINSTFDEKESLVILHLTSDEDLLCRNLGMLKDGGIIYFTD